MSDHQDSPAGTPPADEVDVDESPPAFGPSGYLPERAARRARKIVLRAPMGLQWVVGALVVGVLVAVAGWFALRTTLPGPPSVEVTEAALEAQGLDGAALETTVADQPVVVLDVLGRVRVFDWSSPTTAPPAYCRESGLLESPDGDVWRATGRGIDGTPSLVELPTTIVDGRVFVDPTDPLQPLAPDPNPAPEAACGAAG